MGTVESVDEEENEFRVDDWGTLDSAAEFGRSP